MVDQPPSFIYLALLGVYVLVMCIIGYFANRKVHTVEDYLVGGRKLSFMLAVPTIVAIWYGVGFCMGVSGTVYASGVRGVLADPFGSTIAFVVAGLFFAARFRRLHLLTVADILGKRYGKGIEICASALMMPFYIGTLAAQMVALGYLLHLFAHIDTTTGIMVGSFFMLLYTMAGGMWAVSLTDFIQMTVLLTGLFLLLPTVWHHMAQDPNAWQTLKSEFAGLIPTAKDGSSWLVYCGQLCITGLGGVMGQDLVQRCLSCRSEKVARYSVLAAGVIYFMLGFIPIIIGIAGRTLEPGLASPEALLPHLANTHLSPIILVIFVAGLIMAIMSTADSYLLAGTSILTLNVLLPLIPVVKSERARLWVLRASSFVMALIAVVLAISGFNIFQLVVHSGVMLLVAVFVPVTMALYWKRATSTAAWSSIICGVGAWVSFVTWGYALLDLSGDELLYAAAPIGAAASLTSYLIASWVRISFKKSILIEDPLPQITA